MSSQLHNAKGFEHLFIPWWQLSWLFSFLECACQWALPSKIASMTLKLSYTQDGCKPIHLACIHGDVEMVRWLIKMGSNPRALTEDEVRIIVNNY